MDRRAQRTEKELVMRIGIIGGGLMGITLAYLLAKAGDQVTVLEQGVHLGGLNDQLQVDSDWVVPRYQQTLMPSDSALYNLCVELGIQHELIFQSARAGFVSHSTIHPMSNIFDFLSFSVIGLRDRFRLGRMILQTRGTTNWRELDSVSAKDWLIRVGGVEAFERIWRPLLEAKFDGVYDRVSATYIWAWLNRMGSVRQVPQLSGTIGYFKHGHYALIQALTNAFLSLGGQVEYHTRVREIELKDGKLGRIRTYNGMLEFDAVIAAVATPIFAHLIPAAFSTYQAQLAQSAYLGLICPVMVLNAPLSNYWTLNLTDPSYPFATVIQTPYPDKPDHYVVHLPRYIAPDNDWMGVPDDDIREAWLSHLTKIFPNFEDSQMVHFAVSRSRYVEPIHTINMLQNALDIRTPYTGLYLANTAQVYPHLSTTEAVVAHARQVMSVVRAGQPVRIAG